MFFSPPTPVDPYHADSIAPPVRPPGMAAEGEPESFSMEATHTRPISPPRGRGRPRTRRPGREVQRAGGEMKAPVSHLLHYGVQVAVSMQQQGNGGQEKG